MVEREDTPVRGDVPREALPGLVAGRATAAPLAVRLVEQGGDGKATLTPRIYVGARLRGGPPSTVLFDSVTLGED